MSLADVLVLADSAFPSGTFGHSFGLETAIVEGRANDADGIRAWIERYTRDGLATLDASAFVLALRDGVAIETLDELVAAAIVAEEIRAANRQLAQATLTSYEMMGLESTRLRAYDAAVQSGEQAGIHALAVALGYDAAAIPWPDALRAYVSSAVAALVSVGTRAIPLGQRRAIRLLWDLRPLVEDVARKAESCRSVDDLRAQAFECEIDAMRHAALEGRMFVS